MKASRLKVVMLFFCIGLMPIGALAGIPKDDDCKGAVEKLAKGIVNSYREQGQRVKVLHFEPSRTDEFRNYSLDVDVNGCIDSYDIELWNDSAFKCLLHQIRQTQSCG